MSRLVPMGAAMSAFPYAVAALRGLPEPREAVDPPEARSAVDGPLILAPDLPSPPRRWRAVLAPLLPTMFLLSFCVAGLADPPAHTAGGGTSRLHVPAEAPPVLPAVPLTR